MKSMRRTLWRRQHPTVPYLLRPVSHTIGHQNLSGFKLGIWSKKGLRLAYSHLRINCSIIVRRKRKKRRKNESQQNMMTERALPNKWDSGWWASQQCNIRKPIPNNRWIRFGVSKRWAVRNKAIGKCDWWTYENVVVYDD